MAATQSLPTPSFPNLQAGMSHLARLPLAHPAAAEEQLIQFVDSLLATPPDAADLFALLEQARLPMSFVEAEMARRYHNQPLALGEVEEAGFRRVADLWRRMAKAYALCARLGPAADTRDPRHAARIAAILHRCIHYTGMVVLEHYRARRELPSGVWLDLHGYYESAEEWEVALTPVDDVLEPDSQATHCTAAYVTVLLVEMAGPYSRSVRDLDLIRRWAGMWGPLVSVHRLDDDPQVPPYVLELMEDTGLHLIDTNLGFSPDARRLDTSRLAGQIDQALGQLRQKAQPSQLGLGEETSAYVLALLEQLSRPWAQSAAVRKFRRFQAKGTARLCVGFEAMHFFVTGREFAQPDSVQTTFESDFEIPSVVEREPPDFPIEEWAVLNHSAAGFRLARSAAGQKMAHQQLLALCPHDGERFMLGQTTWLMQDQEGGLVAGIAVLPGLPEGVAVRMDGDGRGEEEFVRAFLLPPIPAIEEGAALVVPLGTYQASRQLEVRNAQEGWQVRMQRLLQRGMDFERISFVPV